MANFLLLIVDVWVLGILAMLLHYYSPRISLIPFFVYIGGLIFPTQSQLGIYIQPAPDVFMFVTSDILVPVILASVFILYIANGAAIARMTIYTVGGMTLVVLLFLFVYRLHLSLPGGDTATGFTIDQLIRPFNPRINIGSFITFIVDMFAIAIFYQGIKNEAPKMPEWLIIGLTLLVSLWTDAIFFRFIVDLGTPDFIALLPGDLLAKTISALILWPLLAYYLTHLAPRMPDHVGAENRPTLDIFFGSLNQIKQMLASTQTALREAELKNRQEAEYFQQISDNISEGLWLLNPDQSKTLYVNRAYEEIWGRSAQSIYQNNMTFPDSLHPEDRDRILASIGQQRIAEYQQEFRIVRPNGEVRWVRDVSFPIHDEAGNLLRIAGITQDITERKHLEKQALELELEREKVKFMRDFMSEASHDLKSPLSAINLKVHLLINSPEPEKRQAHADELQQLAHRMSHLIDDLMTLTRLDNLNEMALVKLDFRPIIQTIYETLYPIMENKNITPNLSLTDEVPALVAAPDDLSRALANLIDNAVRYTPEGGQISVQSQITPQEAIIHVSDTGIGIKTEEQSHIFERFYRSTNAKASNPSGTGLGLVIVKKIIDQHQGRIEIKSEIGKGTTFSIYLPRADSDLSQA